VFEQRIYEMVPIVSRTVLRHYLHVINLQTFCCIYEQAIMYERLRKFVFNVTCSLYGWCTALNLSISDKGRLVDFFGAPKRTLRVAKLELRRGA